MSQDIPTGTVQLYLNEDEKKTLGELQAEKAKRTIQLNQIQEEILISKKTVENSKRQIKYLNDNEKTISDYYSGVGRMFVKTSGADVIKSAEEQVKTHEQKIKELTKYFERLTNEAKTFEKQFNEFINKHKYSGEEENKDKK